MTMNMRFFIIAAAATLLAACTQENEVQNNPVEARITAGVSGPKTRAVDNGWNADRIGVMVVDAPGTTTTMGGKYKNVGYATTSTGTNADFTPMTAGGGIFFEDAFLEFTFAAYAPYASGANAYPAWYRREDYGKYKQPAHDHGTGEGGLHPCHGSQGR